jgi:hypothetical protein
LFEALDAISFGEHKNLYHFNTGTLSWSLTRLFGCYERVMSAMDLPREQSPFLDADIESYIIRFRIVLNDIAYITWQLLPKNTRGLKEPRGGTHPRNREMSILSLVKFLNEHSAAYPELAAVFSKATPWMTRLKNDRDNVVHYKTQVVVIETEPLSFALINAAGTQRTEATPEGGKRLVLEPIADFVNGQMLALHGLMHEDLASAVRAHAARLNFKLIQVGCDHRMSCIGVKRFRSVNAAMV